MKVAFFSSDPISLPSIRYLQAEHELVCIVSNPDRPKGRGKKVSPNEVSQWAIDNSVDLLRPEGKPSDADVAHLREVGAELLIVMAYGCILKKNILEYGKYPCLNLHASLLPELRGASPIETAIALGKTRTGVSLMRVEPAMDTGAVADAEEVDIDFYDTAKTLRQKIAISAADILKKNMPLIESGELNFVQQNSAEATYSRKLSREDMFLDFRKSARELRDRVRAFGAGIFQFGLDAIKIFDIQLCENTGGAGCATVISSGADGLKIACADGAICANRLQKPCARAMQAREFFSGYEIPKGTILSNADNKPLLHR